MRARSSSYANGRPMTSSAPRSSARTRSTGSDEGDQQDHGHVAIPASARLAAAQALAEVELPEEHEVGPDALGELERLAPARCVEHVEAVVAELAAEVLARLDLGLCDEERVRHAPTLAASQPRHQMSFATKRVKSVPQPSPAAVAARPA